MSMIRSNKTSVMREVTIVDLVLSKLITVQVDSSFDHLLWIYGRSVSKSSWSETVEIKNSPVGHL